MTIIRRIDNGDDNTRVQNVQRASVSRRARNSAPNYRPRRERMSPNPRWAEHRRKLAAAQEARRMTLWENEIAAIVAMCRKGRTFSYIAEEIGVCRDVIIRELTTLGIATARVKADQRISGSAGTQGP